MQVRGPQRYNKLYLVTISKSWKGLHEHLMDHALLKACMEELDLAGYSYKLPKGTVFSDAENYSAAVAAGGDAAVATGSDSCVASCSRGAAYRGVSVLSSAHTALAHARETPRHSRRPEAATERHQLPATGATPRAAVHVALAQDKCEADASLVLLQHMDKARRERRGGGRTRGAFALSSVIGARLELRVAAAAATPKAMMLGSTPRRL